MVKEPQAAREAGRRRVSRLTGLTMAGSLALGGWFTVAAQAAYSGKAATVPASELPIEETESPVETDPSTVAPSLGANTGIEPTITTSTTAPTTLPIKAVAPTAAPAIEPGPTTAAPEPITAEPEPEATEEPATAAPTTQAPRPRVTAAPAPKPRPAKPARPATGSGGS
jgi:outer membrane biosynthesis protein TonB